METIDSRALADSEIIRQFDTRRVSSKSKKQVKIERYCTLKARGVGFGSDNYTYYLTQHRTSVRAGGYEYETDNEKELRRIRRKLEKLTYADNLAVVNERFEQSVVRSRSVIQQLAANNPWEYFVTLTLKRDSKEFDAYDLSTVAEKLLQFLVNYSRRRGKATGFKYLLIPERHVDGAYHFHGLMKGINPEDLTINENCYLDFRPYSRRFGYFSAGKDSKVGEAWEEGVEQFLGDGISAGKIRDLQKTASYITKYITKDMFKNFDNPDKNSYYEPGTHLYFCSKGLDKDILIKRGQSVYRPEDFEESGCEVVCDNDFCVKVKIDMETGLRCIVDNTSKRSQHERNNSGFLTDAKARKSAWNRVAEKNLRIRKQLEYLTPRLDSKHFERITDEEIRELFGASRARISSEVEYEQEKMKEFRRKGGAD